MYYDSKDDFAIKFENLTKEYKLYKSDKARFLGLFSKKVSYNINRALSEVSFCAEKGESIAFFGQNGAGKSTLLKMITGVSFPTEGDVFVNGKVSALLELSSGFDIESTGRENIYLKCGLMGMTDEEIKTVEEDIVEFADIGEYIDQPIRCYSSGMKARLGFAINVNANPDIFIVDEALSVGDKNFRKKCQDRISEIMSDKNVTLLFVTHSISMAKEFCKRGIVLEKGKILFDGTVDEAIEFYNARS